MFASERGRRVVGVVRPRARSDDELTRRDVYVEVHNIVNVCSKGFSGTPLCMTVKAAGEAWDGRAYCVLGLEKRDVSGTEVLAHVRSVGFRINSAAASQSRRSSRHVLGSPQTTTYFPAQCMYQCMLSRFFERGLIYVIST